MRPFLPKRSSSAAASSRPKMVPTQQPAKATLGQTPPTEVPGPQPKIVLDPALREYSWLMRQEEERAKSRCSQTAPQKASVMPPSPRSVPGADGKVFVKNTVVNTGYFYIAPTQPIAVIERKIKHKHIQKESTYPLPLIASLRPPLSGLPLETIQPLATRAEAWQAIPGVSNWVLGVIKRG